MPTKIQERLIAEIKNLPTPETKLMLYLFDKEGKIVAKAPVEKGEAMIDLPEKTEELCLHLGPVLPKETEEAEAALKVIRESSPEIAFRVGEKLIVDADLFLPLVLQLIVEGRVVHVETLRGVKMELPVPHVIVKVLEVDPPFFPIPGRTQVLAQTVTNHEGYFLTTIKHNVLQPFPWDFRPDIAFAVYALNPPGIPVLLKRTQVKWNIEQPVYFEKIYV